jgi:hypothetical protein
LLDQAISPDYRGNSFLRDRVAQLVARFLDMEKVTGSSPVAITIFYAFINDINSFEKF